MVITFDDQFLITVSEDSCLFIWKIIDKEGQGLKREKELIYAEEILITKSDLEEKVISENIFLCVGRFKLYTSSGFWVFFKSVTVFLNYLKIA